MARWFRVYADLVDDPKVQRLSGELIKALLNLWCLAAQNDGRLPDLDTIAFKLRVNNARAQKIVGDLVTAGLIDETETEQETSRSPHNWDARQHRGDTDPTAATRAQRYRDRKRDVTVKSSHPVTRDDSDSSRPPDTEYRDRSREEEKKDAAVAAPIGVPAPDPDADYFRRGREMTIPGGVLAKLKKAKNGSVPLARAALEQASTKHNPVEYIMRIVNGHEPDPPSSPFV